MTITGEDFTVYPCITYNTHRSLLLTENMKRTNNVGGVKKTQQQLKSQ